ncbi:MAG: class I SAM-dependent methyltransferase [Zoogloea sp.]|uniref:class I SAM-dependent methyltransferase n=1 Tax=Zoogloea sp. TaxID=49181 RepID=UPI00260EE770|nr:class I SAM-dependent methyltransferase [Zoogloea sp.]MDD2987866.1 class I SAM-dependent methyltransferase [Zoogloea sp.]
MEIRQQIRDWPTRYHFSPRRANLLRPLLPYFEGKDVLEVGAGCGAISRFLGESGARVVALEGSGARARITAARCKGLGNVDVVADVFQSFPVEARFDVVTLIGVLEYARIFFAHSGEDDPVDAMLQHARRFLRPGGVLILAIENQLGLKYFAGCLEDHVSVPMFGIQDLYSENGVVTFGKQELVTRLQASGFVSQSWFYPFPDYKLPTSVVTEDGMAAHSTVDLSPLMSASVVADSQTPPRFLFSLEQAWGVVYRNGLAGDLANSFLVVAGGEDMPRHDPNVLVHHYSVERLPRFSKAVMIRQGESGARVESRLLCPQSAAAPGDRLGLKLADGDFLAGSLWQKELFRALNKQNWSVGELALWADIWVGHLLELISIERQSIGLDTRIDGCLLDAVPRNLLVNGIAGQFIDLEWNWKEGVEFGHLLYRAIMLGLLSVGSVAAPCDPCLLNAGNLFVAVCRELGFDFSWERFERVHCLEREIQYQVNGVEWIRFDEIAGYRLSAR